jgi:threonine/homoserine/homoserine lactone efflux protein
MNNMTDAIISGLLLGLALIFSVGPVVFTILKLRINYGIASAFSFVAGVWISDLLWVITANFFSSLLGEVIAFKNTIGVAGGIFLIALGIFYLFLKKYHNKDEIDNGIKIASTTHIKLFITGFLINTLNPAVIALWFAAATKSMANNLDERIAVFSICLFMNMGADIFKINLAGKLRKNLTDRNINIINKISGILFIAFGIALLLGVLYTKKS